MPDTTALLVEDFIDDSNDDAPVVLVHGAMDRHQSFRRVARRLDRYNVRTYDRRGYSGSIDVAPAHGLDRHVADLIALLPDEPAIVVGHSVGGLITLTAAAHFPHRFRSIGAFEPPTGWKPWWPDDLCVLAGESPPETVERFYRQMVGDHAWERLSEPLRAELLAEGPALQIDLQAARHSQPFEPFEISAPVLLGHGSETNEHYKRATVELVDELPTAALRVIDGAFHGAHRSHPDHFADFVTEVAHQ